MNRSLPAGTCMLILSGRPVQVLLSQPNRSIIECLLYIPIPITQFLRGSRAVIPVILSGHSHRSTIEIWLIADLADAIARRCCNPSLQWTSTHLLFSVLL